MRTDVTTDLSQLFRVLKGRGFIGASNFNLISGTLNPNDSRNVRFHVPWIARALYQRLAEHGVSFDALVGVPSGGEPYTLRLVEMIRWFDRRRVPHVWLQKAECDMRVEDMGGSTRNARVVVVDDCVYTGNALRKATEALAAVNVSVAAYLTVADLNYGGDRKLEAPLVSVFNKAFLEREKIYA